LNHILYQFNVAGFIPGYPGEFPAGTWVKIDPDTNALLETGPIAVDQDVEPPADVPPDVPQAPSTPVDLPPPSPQGAGG
jgi:hypothetical protein